MKSLNIALSLGLVLGGCSTRPPKKIINSPFPPSAPGLTIPNAHVMQIQSKGAVIRGQSPHGKVSELKETGVTQILIFKDGSDGRVNALTKELKSVGFHDSQIHKIPFKWKDLPPFREACQQTVKALNLLIQASRDPSQKIYFHCTAGEDRTGYLAGLLRMVIQGWSKEKAFLDEMCEYGYGAADPTKPTLISETLDRGLTPLFIQMATAIETQKIRPSNLNTLNCDSPPPATASVSQFSCKPSEKLKVRRDPRNMLEN